MQSFALETPQHRVKTTKEKPRQASINPQFFTSRDSNRVMPRTVFVGKVRTGAGGGSGEEPKMREKPAEPVQGRREQLFMWTLMMRDIAQGRATRNAFES